uniref:AbrB/MazE/SpoVT family DNA-binding domain-containing protein n=1 Tax=Pararhizobium sp. IMCC3301 TaxID=3067904 RepID=UPI0027411703|nr:AbrB/MazE/SpoVT family DNA-binding domain-containing protein [Pararhizobium sp. IMCC3301]
MPAVRVKIGTNGRLVIPAAIRRKVGLEEGQTVLLEAGKGELRVRRLEDVVDQAQRTVKKYVKDHASLSEELIADRRAEAEREG